MEEHRRARFRHRWAFIAPLAALALASACKSPPAPNAGFILDRPGAEKPAGIPFQKFWVKPGFRFGNYQRIMVSPIDTQHQLPTNPVLTAGTDYKRRYAELTAYAEESFRRAFREDPRHLYQVVSERGPRTLLLEVAIVELVPARPVVNAITFMFTYLVFQRGGVAIEGRFRDATSGEVVVTFADKEMAKFYPLNVRDFTYLGHPESIVDAWAGQLVAVAGRRGNEPVKEQGRIGLRPW
jgi:hypothetical protein